MHNLIDLDKYQGLCSSSNDVVLRTMTEIVSQGNYILAGLSTLLGVQVIKSDVTAASAGLTLYALLPKHAVHDPPVNIAKVCSTPPPLSINLRLILVEVCIITIGIPIFTVLNAIPKLGLIVAVALEFRYATPWPLAAFAITFAVVTTIFLGLLC
ncbi:hypothetical protein JAAARDRAFT_198126 [Jaapia argillacea MUCL 33604]|uniref:Uncharacterized protein n=1 Tax=Jaapia argillacea MUCL 33604 TaxID=933084 RepID=A0A067PQ75_9AGAM|nr:hypothetical protein JAAARDRAFT_198126 [Jaapia argillacea MUCL 33604]